VIELAARTKKRKTADVIDAKPVGAGLATAHPKPAKRLNAKERAKEKYAKERTGDRTTPGMTAKAKSKAEAKAERAKRKKSKAAETAA